MVLFSRKEYGENMKFKRGIFCGLLVIVCSICEIIGHKLEHEGIGWIYMFTLVLGIFQLIASVSYQKRYKKFLVLCLGLEGMYYVISIINLLVYDITVEVKVFGVLIGIGILMLIVTSIKSLIPDSMKE